MINNPPPNTPRSYIPKQGVIYRNLKKPIKAVLKIPPKTIQLLSHEGSKALPARVVGAIGACICAYNVIVDGSSIAHQQTKDEMGTHYKDMYINHLSSSRNSNLLEKVKNYAVGKRLDSPIIPFCSWTKNHVTGFFGEVIGNTIPIALSALALGSTFFFNKHNEKVTNITKDLNESINCVRSWPIINLIPKIKLDPNNIDINRGMARFSNGTEKALHSFPLSAEANKLGRNVAGLSAFLLLLYGAKIVLNDALDVGKKSE